MYERRRKTMPKETPQPTLTRRGFIKGSVATLGLLASIGLDNTYPGQKHTVTDKDRKNVMGTVENNQSYTAVVMQIPLHGFRDTEQNKAWIKRNAKRIATIIERLATSSDIEPRLIVFPVLSLLGVGSILGKLGITPSFNIEELAVDLANDPRLDPIRSACKRYSCYMAASCVEKVPGLSGRFFHTGFILGPEGLVLRSPKTQAPTSPGITLLRDFYYEYTQHFGTDAILPVAETPIGKLACLVEGESLIPEAVRKLRKKGAEIILHPTLEHEGHSYPPYMALRQTHAYTNGVYWLSAAPSREIVSVKGNWHETWYGGGSSIIGPDGTVESALVGRFEGKATALIKLEHIRSCREKQEKRTKPEDILYRDLYT